MGGKNSKSIIRFHTIIYHERKKQELVNIAYSKDALTNYIQRHRNNIDELLSWDSHSETALHFVVNEGWMEGVEAIVEAGADVNVFDANKFEILPNVPGREAYVLYTPLMCVVGNHRNLEIAQYLLAHGADPHLRCPNTGWSAVSLAIANCRVDLILLLIEEYDVEPTKVFDMTCEWLFRKYNRSSKLDTIVLIELLLEKGAQMRPHYVHFALNRGWLEVLKVFVKAGADINSFDTGHEFTLDVYTRGIYLQPHSRRFPWNMYTPLMRAARSPDLFDHAQYLLAQGANPHLKCPNTGESAVSVAIKHSNAELVQLLIQKYNVKCDPTKALTMIWNVLHQKRRIEQDMEEFIELLLEKGAQMGLHYMHVAVTRGWSKLVEIFVKAGSDVNVFDTDSFYRPSRECIKCFNPAHHESVSQSCSCSHQPFDSGLQTRIRHTPFMKAATSQDLSDIAQYLLAQGADPHLKCPNTGESALSVATAHSNIDLVWVLIERYSVEFDPNKVLTMTCEWLFHYKNEWLTYYMTQFIKLVVQKGAQIRSHHVHFAVEIEWLEGVKMFRNAGGDINKFNAEYIYMPEEGFRPCHRPLDTENGTMYTPLMRAARSPDLFDIAQYLLAHGADPHLRCPNTGESALSVATAHSNVDLVRLLIEKYNIECDPSKVLTMTCEWLLKSVNMSHEHDITEYLELLLDKGARIDSEFINIAISLGWKAGVEVIVEAGADINLFHEEDQIMYTPLMRAARFPYLFDIAQYLLSHGADPNLRCPNTGESALSIAILYCNTVLIRLLIQKGNVEFDPSNVLTDICKRLPSHSHRNEMYKYQTRECIKLLLTKGAQMGSHYKTVIKQLLPMQHISLDDLQSYFREGFNINILCKYYIESDNEYCANHIRWFLRHGLDTNAHFIEICFKKALKTQNNEIVTLLLHAGVDRFVITRWVKRRRFPGLPKLRECNELAYNEFQEEDLVEFSDVSLHIYPEVKELSENEIDRQYNSLVRLVSRPFTLQGLCRQCLRQSLCEPSPTVLMTLPIPKCLKRYILCHDL